MQTVTVYDRGPSEPVKPADPLVADHLSEVEQADRRRYAQQQRDFDEWHKAHDEPIAVTMPTVDARHAVAADPERYSMEPIPAHVPNLSLADRVTLIERRLDALEGADKEEVVEPPVDERSADFRGRHPTEALSPKATA